MRENAMKKRKIYLILFCAMLGFIWGNSMLSAEASGAISHFVASLIGIGDGPSADEGHHLLRKAAHFTEYAILGALSGLLFDSLSLDDMKKYVSAALIGFSVPLIDETIQIFSGRGPAIADIWIDIAGFALGAAVSFLVIFKRQKCKSEHTENGTDTVE